MGDIRVLLALEPLMLRELLRLAVDNHPDIRVVADVPGGDVDAIMAATRRHRPNVAVLTMAEPGHAPGVGVDLMADDPELIVLLLSDRVAGARVCRGNPPRCRGLTLHSVAQVVGALRDAHSPED